MGCVVNGPGEAREADLGVASGNGKGQIFVRGEVIKTVPEAKIVETLIEEALRRARPTAPPEIRHPRCAVRCHRPVHIMLWSASVSYYGRKFISSFRTRPAGGQTRPSVNVMTRSQLHEPVARKPCRASRQRPMNPVGTGADP
jgi:GcpE protein